MQNLRNFHTLVFLSLLFAACSGSAGTKHPNSNAPVESSAAENNGGNTSFSFLLDGQPIDGKGVDELQLRNTAFIYPDEGKGEMVLFNLYSTKDGEDTKPAYFLRLKCPAKPGTYTKNGLNDDANKCHLMLDLLSGDFSRYQENTISITIESITSSRLAGSFSGTLVLSNDTPRGTKKHVTITNGKFDIPFSTSKLRPE